MGSGDRETSLKDHWSDAHDSEQGSPRQGRREFLKAHQRRRQRQFGRDEKTVHAQTPLTGRKDEGGGQRGRERAC